MGCEFETNDHKFMLSSDHDLSRFTTDQSTEYAFRQLSSQLIGKDATAANKVLVDSQLLPGMEIVGATDQSGIMRDTSGNKVFLNEKELRERAAQELQQRHGELDLAIKALDHYHSSTDGLLGLFGSPTITKDDIKKALSNPDLTADESKGLNFMSKKFERLSSFDGTISREELEQEGKLQDSITAIKLNYFINGNGKIDPSGTYSEFDWADPDSCDPNNKIDPPVLSNQRTSVDKAPEVENPDLGKK